MNMTAASRPAPPSTSWTPPLDAEGLARVVSGLRGVRPLDAILDDVGDVLSNQAPREDEFAELDERLRGDLRRLVNIAVAAENDDGQVADLIGRAQTLTAEELPADYRAALGYLRRTAGVTNDLLERLTETGTIKDVA